MKQYPSVKRSHIAAQWTWIMQLFCMIMTEARDHTSLLHKLHLEDATQAECHSSQVNSEAGQKKKRIHFVIPSWLHAHKLDRNGQKSHAHLSSMRTTGCHPVLLGFLRFSVEENLTDLDLAAPKYTDFILKSVGAKFEGISSKQFHHAGEIWQRHGKSRQQA